MFPTPFYYYLATDWLQYEEIEDAEERDKKAVSNPQTGGEEKDEKMDEDNQLWVEKSYTVFSFRAEKINPKKTEKHTLPITAGPNKCAVCHESFDSFFDQDSEVCRSLKTSSNKI